MFLFLHFLACICYSVVTLNDVWIPPADFMYLETDLYLEETTDVHKYLKMMYNATLVFGGIDIAPRTYVEVLAFTLIMIVS